MNTKRFLSRRIIALFGDATLQGMKKMNYQDSKNHAEKLTRETGTLHEVYEVAEGFFQVMPIQPNNSPPVDVRHHDEPPVPTIPTILLADMMAREYVANWLIDGLIEQSDLGLIFGSSGGGKSFVVLDMAYCIAAGIPYHGRNTKKRACFMFAGKVTADCKNVSRQFISTKVVTILCRFT